MMLCYSRYSKGQQKAPLRALKHNKETTMRVPRKCKISECNFTTPVVRTVCNHHRYLMSKFGSYDRPDYSKPMRYASNLDKMEWVNLYNSGKSIAEVASLTGWSSSNIHTYISKYHKTRSRSDTKKDDLNPMWLGDDVGYTGVHLWVARRKAKPEFCELCRKEKPRDLANISQQYKRSVNDFEWLCRRCHMKKDGRLDKFMKARKEKL